MTSDRYAVATLRTAAEREALGAATYLARVHDLGTPPERPFLDALPIARRDVRDRLVRGLLRGSPPGLPEPTTIDPDADELTEAFPFDPPDDVPTGGCDRIALLPLPASERVLAAPIAAVGGFERLRVGEPVRLVGPETGAPVTHPVDLVPPLRREGAFVDDDQPAVIEAELAESVANLALAHLAERVLAAESPDRPLAADPVSLPAADRPSHLERIVTRGHPFHPSAKIRRGMGPGDGLAYAPEFASTIDLRFAAIRDDVARRTRVDGRTLTERLYRAFDGLQSAVEAAVPADAAAYAVVPVHPWQFHHVLPDRYERQLEDGRVVPIADYARPATPLLNLRTVVPGSDGDEPLPHCKLPIGVQTTNVERTLSPQAVHNGPRTTRLWRTIDERESFERLGALEERAAASYYPPGGPHVEGSEYDDARHLGGLIRQNPRTHPLVSGDALPVPAASLVAAVPGTDRPLLGELLDRAPEPTGTDAAASFLRAYADAVVPPQLRLLTTYGVALESHLQNCYVVVEGWRPVGTIVRDFGGIRVHGARLAERGIDFEPYPDSDLDADGRDDLYRKLYYALFQNHLSEIVETLVRTTTVDAATCWERIGAVSRATFDRLRADGAAPDSRIDADERALFEDPIPFKALTTMRLQGKRHEYATSRVSNPLVSAPDTLTWG